MNNFEETIAKISDNGLSSVDISTVQVNLGLKCNQQCRHCHLECSPQREETMHWCTMELVLSALGCITPRLVDITGGAPELNANLCRFITALTTAGHSIQVRTNLTALLEPGIEALPDFFRRHRVALIASMPCYGEENVIFQRGPDVYKKSIEAIKLLNTLGYGIKPDLPLILAYNPGGPFLPPQQSVLESDYRSELKNRFNITFTRLITITNMPIGRFHLELLRENKVYAYMRLLREHFNPKTIDGLMCRHQINIGWDGRLYDCDFNLALRIPINHGAPDHIRYFDPFLLARRRIVTGEHCFGCTAGCGSSCTGSLI